MFLPLHRACGLAMLCELQYIPNKMRSPGGCPHPLPNLRRYKDNNYIEKLIRYEEKQTKVANNMDYLLHPGRSACSACTFILLCTETLLLACR